jgi:hypothetical protein
MPRSPRTSAVGESPGAAQTSRGCPLGIIFLREREPIVQWGSLECTSTVPSFNYTQAVPGDAKCVAHEGGQQASIHPYVVVASARLL